VRGGFFGVPEGRFAGDFWGGSKARMGGFAAKFRGFRVAQGCGEAIQCTADMGGLTGRKNFLKIFKIRVKTRKLGCERCWKVDWGAPYIGCAGRFLGTIFRSEG
jgi:hypothetical protein